MAYLIGAVLAVATLLFVQVSRLDRHRALYPSMLIVVACTYDLFAVVAGPPSALWIEAGITMAFVAVAVVGFRTSPWAVVIGLALHGLLDAWHPLLIDNAGVPSWWPSFCMTFDLVAAALLALDLARRSSQVNEVPLSSCQPVHSGGERHAVLSPAQNIRRSTRLPMVVLMLLGLSTTAGVWATAVGPQPLHRHDQPATSPEKIEPYHARFGRVRPVIAIVGENSATELTDFVIPYGILARANVADLVTVSTRPGVMSMRPALQLHADVTTVAFDERYGQGADYVIVPAVVKHNDRTLLDWICQQSSKGATIVSICDGALVVANTGLMNGHRATAHSATLSYRRKHFGHVTWVENSRYVADGRIVSSAGISASIPVSLALVEALAGKDRAGALARELGVRDWSSRHDSQLFSLRFGRNLAALAATNAINPVTHRKEAIGLPIENGADEIALALTADAYSRTGRSKAYAVSPTKLPVRTQHGLMFVADRRGQRLTAIGRVEPLNAAPPGLQLGTILAAIQHDYGRLTAFGVALQFESPDFR